MSRQIIRSLFLFLPLLACQTAVTPNPYDPNAPADAQLPATLTGSLIVRGSGEGVATPIVDANVTLTNLSNGVVEQSGTSNADGFFDFGSFPAGQYSVSATHPQFYNATQELVLLPGSARDLTLELDPLVQLPDPIGHISGKVHKSLQLSLSPERQDHSGIFVEIVGTGVRTVTNAAGDFDLFTPAGTYSLQFYASQYSPITIDSVTVAAGGVTSFGAEAIILQASPGHLSGRFVLENATDGQFGGIDVVLSGQPAVRTAADGTFVISGLNPGTYSLSASKTGYTPYVRADLVIEGGNETELPSVTLAISRAQVTGQVKLAGRSDHSGTLVELTGTTFTAITNSTGDFSIAGVAAGTYQLTARRSGFVAGVSPSVTVAGNGKVTIPNMVLSAQQGDFLIASGGEYTLSRSVQLTLNAVDAVFMRISESPDFIQLNGNPVPYQSYNPHPTVELSSGDGLKTLYVEYLDQLNLPSEVYQSSIVLDTTGPQNMQLSVDNGSMYSRNASGTVTLGLSASDAVSGVKEMQISFDGDFSTSIFVPFSAQSSLVLADPLVDGVKEVYVRLRDAAGNTSNTTLHTQITLDRVAPTLTQFSLRCNGVLNPSICNNIAVELVVEANSDVDTMALTNGAAFDGEAYEMFTTPRTWFLSPGDGNKIVSIKLMDKAGNKSVLSSVSTVLDTAAPSPPVLAPSVASTSASTVTLSLAQFGTPDPTTTYEVIGGQYLDFTAVIGDSWTFTIGDVDGIYAFGVRTRDAAGNVSAPYFVTIRRDTHAPSSPTGLSATYDNDDTLLTWNINFDSDLGGYRVLYSTTNSANKADYSVVDVGKETRYRLSNMQQPLYFAIEAYDQTSDPAPNRSAMSPRLRMAPNPISPTLLQTTTLASAQFGSGALLANNDFVYVAVPGAGLHIFDARLPGALNEIGTGLAALSERRDMRLANNTLYLSCGFGASCPEGVRMVDVTNPLSPTDLGLYTGAAAGPRKFAHFIPAGEHAFGVIQENSNVRVAKFTLPCVANCTTEIAAINDNLIPNDADASSQTVAVALGSGGLQIIHVPLNDLGIASLTLASAEFANRQPVSVAMAAPYVMVGLKGSGGGMAIVDGDTGSVVGSVSGFECSDIAVAGTYAFCTNTQSTIVAIDISDRSAPRVVRSVSDGNGLGATRLAVRSNDVFVLGQNRGGLNAYELMRPASMTGSASLSGAYFDIEVQGIYAYVAGTFDNVALSIFDISNARTPILVREIQGSDLGYSAAEQARVDVSGSLVTLGSATSDIRITLDVGNPLQPELLHSTTDAQTMAASTEYVAGNYAFICDGSNGITAYDIRDAVSPELLFADKNVLSPSSVWEMPGLLLTTSSTGLSLSQLER